MIFKPLDNYYLKKSTIFCNFIAYWTCFDLKQIAVKVFEIKNQFTELKFETDKTTHLSIPHCFHVVSYIIATQYMHVRYPEKKLSTS